MNYIVSSVDETKVVRLKTYADRYGEVQRKYILSEKIDYPEMRKEGSLFDNEEDAQDFMDKYMINNQRLRKVKVTRITL